MNILDGMGPEYAFTDGYRRGENGTLRSPAGYSVQYNFQETSSGGVMSMKISGFPEEQRDYPEYSPHQYEYEGRDSDRQSLDQLTVSNLGDNLDFLQNLGPKFNALGGICQQSMERRNVRL